MNNKKLGIFFVSRNNYSLFDVWMDRVDSEGYTILSIDEDSTPENKKIGKEICNKHGIHYMDRENKGLQNNIQSACNFFKEKGVERVIWFQHDCFPQDPQFFSKFDQLIQTGKLDKFGVIGFHINHEGWQMMSRGPLQNPKRDLWVRFQTPTPLPQEYTKPHAIESPAWMCASVSIEQYEKHIIPTEDFQFFHAWDDISFQFLYKNIYNICIPEFKFSHEQIIKKEFNIPVKSVNPDKRDFYYGRFDHHQIWEERWGFNWDQSITFDEVKDHYKDTLIYEFGNHNMYEGPLKTFNI